MATINTNVSSLVAQQAFATNTKNLNTSLQRLSTGLKINSGADDPAGLIASQALQAQQTGINAAISNANQATNVIGTAEGGLNEVSSLLNQLQGPGDRVGQHRRLSSDEVSRQSVAGGLDPQHCQPHQQHHHVPGQNLLDGSLAYTLMPPWHRAAAVIDMSTRPTSAARPRRWSSR